MCEDVQRARVAGEALDEAQARHAAGCEDCKRGAAIVTRVELAMHTRKTSLPDAGFVARATAGAQRRMARQRRQWVFAAGGMVAVAGAMVLWLAVRSPGAGTVAGTGTAGVTVPASDADTDLDTDSDAVPELDEQDMTDLVALTDLDHALRPSVHWNDIIEPIEEYRDLAPEAAAEPPHRRMP